MSINNFRRRGQIGSAAIHCVVYPETRRERVPRQRSRSLKAHLDMRARHQCLSIRIPWWWKRL